jgi:kynurenine formamidase
MEGPYQLLEIRNLISAAASDSRRTVADRLPICFSEYNQTGQLGALMRKLVGLCAAVCLLGCSGEINNQSMSVPLPTEIVDLGTEITTETPRQFWGEKFLQDMGFEGRNSFDVMRWEYGQVSGSNAYYTLFNHGGPHVDAPSHIGVGPGLDAYSVESFVGKVKAFDVSHLESGRSVTVDILYDLSIDPNDVVIMYTGYTAPSNDSDVPETIALSYEAADYLASIPVRAFGTDAFSVASITDQSPVKADDPVARTVPAHFALLSRGIPVYEQLVNVERLLGKEDMLFVGAPLNIKDGDGMMVRPVVLLY